MSQPSQWDTSQRDARHDGVPTGLPSAPPPAPPVGPSPDELEGPARSPARALVDQCAAVVLGDATPIRLAVAAFIAGGHVLFEDVPGVGKTLLAKTLARSLGGSLGRVQGTADLLPSDLTGVSVYDDERRSWEFQPGPLFNNVVLVDELNRATPRTQSALLEAMAEHQVSVDGDTHRLPEPFLVIATQNPQGDLGTFPLVAGQRDRFAVSLSLGLPGRDAERRLIAGWGGEPAFDGISAITGLESWRVIRQRLFEAVHLSDQVAEYALDLIEGMRARIGTDEVLSTRATLALLRVARGHAVVDGRDYVAPDDVQAVAGAVLAHRILDATNGYLPTARAWVEDLVRSVAVPPAVTGSSASSAS